VCVVSQRVRWPLIAWVWQKATSWIKIQTGTFRSRSGSVPSVLLNTAPVSGFSKPPSCVHSAFTPVSLAHSPMLTTQYTGRKVRAWVLAHFLICPRPQGVEDGAEQAEQRRRDDGREDAVCSLSTLAVEANAVDAARECQLKCFERHRAELPLHALMMARAIMSFTCRPGMPVPRS